MLATPNTSITGPLHAHGARTRDEYLQMQAGHLTQLQRARPLGGFGNPHPVRAPMPAIVSGGRWVVLCPCGNAPSASPEWQLACCFECGARYVTVTFPEDREAIEVLLVKRPRQHRHWAAGETIADLVAENAAHGVPV